MELSAASLTVVDFYGDGILNVRCVNDTAHLRAAVAHLDSDPDADSGPDADPDPDPNADPGASADASVRVR
jgi:hypothetical protein